MIWRNWSGDVRCRPARIVHPRDEAEISALVLECRADGRKLRVMGSGHSFTPLVATDDVLVSLDRMEGVAEVDRDRHQVTVRAGTTLHQLGQWLFEQGYAQENLGDIDAQTVAGAISTGTHGSGLAFGNMATQVVGLRLVSGTGDVIDCDPETHPEVFRPARISLGSFGVITQVRLRVPPAYRLHYHSCRESLANCLDNLPTYLQQNRNFEFYWFPYSDRVQLKFMNETTAPIKGGGTLKQASDLLLENGLFGLVSRLCRWKPALCPPVAKLCARLVSDTERVDSAHRIYATRRLVHFHEMEYNIPIEHFRAVIEEIRALTAQQQFAVHFPLECRFVKADDIALSPAYRRDSAYIAVHMYQGMPYEDYFRQVEAIFLRYQGRPHWGKWHSCEAETLAERYPAWGEFQSARAAMDPDGVFLTPYMQALLGGWR